MARLVIRTNGFNQQVILLKLGTNHFGRGPQNDFQLEHPTISVRHCDVVLSAEGVEVRDCGSTNGTFIDGRQIKSAPLQPGQILNLGDVELLVEDTDVNILIPEVEVTRPAPPVVLSDGSLVCPRHPQAHATHQCTHCHEVLCDACVHRLRRRGGKLLKLCPFCSHACVPLGGEKKKKKSFLGFLQKTVKIPFLRDPRRP